MRILLATNNKHKADELKAILSKYYSEVYTMNEAGVSFEVEEDGCSFEENAVKKAAETLAYVGDRFDAVLADDSGLCVDALNGAPGVYSARFAGEGHNDKANNDKLVLLLKDVPPAARTAHFVCCIALVRTGLPTICVRGSVSGIILNEAHGENGFGYDPYFWYEPLKKSFAELSAEEKNQVSHRHNALMLLEEALSE